jgi:hypothetical protein
MSAGFCGTNFIDRVLLRLTASRKEKVSSPMPKFLISIPFVTLAALLVAQTPPPTGVQSLPSQSTTIDDVLVPVPSEIFATLDKFAHSNWRAVQRPELAQWKPHGDQAAIALLLGAVIAEGFVAVEAEDAAEVKSVGRAVLALARGLGVERTALRRSRSIIEHAERGDWPAVRKEWDGVLPDVERAMKELKSEQLAQLVSLGGWLRGTQILSALVLQNYSRENAALLRQPALLDHFEKQFATMRAEMRTKPIPVKMGQGIQRIRTLLASDDGPIRKQMVEEIANVAEELLKSLSSKRNGQKTIGYSSPLHLPERLSFFRGDAVSLPVGIVPTLSLLHHSDTGPVCRSKRSGTQSGRSLFHSAINSWSSREGLNWSLWKRTTILGRSIISGLRSAPVRTDCCNRAQPAFIPERGWRYNSRVWVGIATSTWTELPAAGRAGPSHSITLRSTWHTRLTSFRHRINPRLPTLGRGSSRFAIRFGAGRRLAEARLVPDYARQRCRTFRLRSG